MLNKLPALLPPVNLRNALVNEYNKSRPYLEVITYLSIESGSLN